MTGAADAAPTDSLTGLANRRGAEAWLADELERRPLRHQPLLRHLGHRQLQGINHGYGHQAGDDVVSAVAQVLSSGVRETDLPVRFGGGIRDRPPGRAPGRRAAGADVMRKAIATPGRGADGDAIGLTGELASLKFPRPGGDPRRRRTRKLYQKKRAGKNRVHVNGADESQRTRTRSRPASSARQWSHGRAGGAVINGSAGSG